MEKNVAVVDEQGNEYEATYPKRARGLVKNGRARFVDKNKICLACPPDECMEDNKMECNDVNISNITVDEVWSRIGAIQNELSASMEKFCGCIITVHEGMESDQYGEVMYSEDVAAQKVLAIKEQFSARNESLKILLQFYIDLYKKMTEDQ